MNELSKYLCLLLRHQPEKAELDMDEHGWVSVEQLIVGVNRHSSYKLDRELLEQIVAEDNKGRYRYDRIVITWEEFPIKSVFEHFSTRRDLNGNQKSYSGGIVTIHGGRCAHVQRSGGQGLFHYG